MERLRIYLTNEFKYCTLTGQVENSETSEITETSESDFPMFPFPSFRLRHRVYSKTRKMKTRKIFFRDFREIRVFELPLFTELSKA